MASTAGWPYLGSRLRMKVREGLVQLALRLGGDCVEDQGGLARPRHAGEDGQLPARDLQRDALRLFSRAPTISMYPLCMNGWMRGVSALSVGPVRTARSGSPARSGTAADCPAPARRTRARAASSRRTRVGPYRKPPPRRRHRPDTSRTQVLCALLPRLTATMGTAATAENGGCCPKYSSRGGQMLRFTDRELGRVSPGCGRRAGRPRLAPASPRWPGPR